MKIGFDEVMRLQCKFQFELKDWSCCNHPDKKNLEEYKYAGKII